MNISHQSGKHADDHELISRIVASYPPTLDDVYEYESKGLVGQWKSDGLFCVRKGTEYTNLFFDPKTMMHSDDGPWVIDFSEPGVDANGWTYASSRSHLEALGTGSPTQHWNSYCRRRKWVVRYDDI